MKAIEMMVNEKTDVKEKVIEILRFRGFLIDTVSDGYMLSDNSCLPHDEKYLAKLLSENNLGTVHERRIILNEDCDADKLINSFESIGIIGGEAMFSIWIDWRHFSRNSHGPKIPVERLELYVARYIKAISACGVSTWCSCDGDIGVSRIAIYFSGYGDRAWHNILFDKFLKRRFGIERNDEGRIRLPRHRKQEIYLAVNKAAEFLYEHRIAFRRIKKEALEGRTCSYFRHTPVEIIEKDFIEKAGALLDEYKQEILAKEAG